MAQLDKAPEGLTLSDVSKRMMVSNGNLTALDGATGKILWKTYTVGETKPTGYSFLPQPAGARRVPRHAAQPRPAA